MNLLIKLLVFLYIALVYIYDGTPHIYIIGLILIIFIFFRQVFFLRQIRISQTIIFMLIFLFYSIFSILYALDQNIAFIRVASLVFNIFIVISLVYYIDSTDKIDFLQKAIIYSGLILSIQLIINADLTTNHRLGTDLGSINRMGIMLAFSTLFSIYYLLKKKSFIYLIYSITFITVLLYLGSRQSLIFVIVSLMISYFVNTNLSITKLTKFSMVSLVSIFVTYLLVTSIDSFYFIARRFDSLFEFLSEGTTNEGSISARFEMIKVGLEFFLQNPFFGYGVDNYQVLYNTSFGSMRYSHNNYIELLVGIGVIGLLLYYIPYISELKNTLKYRRNNNLLSILYIGIIISIFIIGMTTVYYSVKIFFLIFAMIISFNLINKRKIESDKSF